MNAIPEMLEKLCFWINEREQVRRLKEMGMDKPWTDDPMLQQYRFCNVDREHDAVTVWIRENIREPKADHPLLWFNLCIARIFNWPPTLATIGFVHNQKKLWEAEMALNAHEGKVFGNAYLVTNSYLQGMTKVSGMIKNTLAPLLDRWRDHNRPEEDTALCWYAYLTSQLGIGPFLGNQIITDMKHTHHLANDPARWDFIQAGPGTLRGLAHLFGAKPPARKAPAAVARARELVLPLVECPDLLYDLNNMGNCLCEFSKYVRGYSKDKYPGV